MLAFKQHPSYIGSSFGNSRRLCHGIRDAFVPLQHLALIDLVQYSGQRWNRPLHGSSIV